LWLGFITIHGRGHRVVGGFFRFSHCPPPPPPPPRKEFTVATVLEPKYHCCLWQELILRCQHPLQLLHRRTLDYHISIYVIFTDLWITTMSSEIRSETTVSTLYCYQVQSSLHFERIVIITTNCMEQNPLWGTGSRSVLQFMEPWDSLPCSQTPALDTVLDKFSPFDTLTPRFFSINLNINLPGILILRSCRFAWQSPTNIWCLWISYIS
jgi:hypothetical protein